MTSSPCQRPHDGQPARPQVLLIEDDPGVRRSLQMLLEGEGYGVRAFASAAAVQADKDLMTAACLVTDYMLGDQDGLSLLRNLRRSGWAGPAILMTACSSPTLAQQADAEGFMHFFAKPFRPHLLVEAVGRAVGAQRS